MVAATLMSFFSINKLKFKKQLNLKKIKTETKQKSRTIY